MPSDSDFFQTHSRFLDTSVTDTKGRRMATRYHMLIEKNREAITGKRILDLASHDGRWSFAALNAGAAHVWGIEAKSSLIKKAHENLQHYGIEAARYRFSCADCLTQLQQIPTGSIDTVFCFGFYYHTLSHFDILKEIQRIGARHLIMDTLLINNNQAIVQMAFDDPTQEGAAVALQNQEDKVLVGIPSKRAMELMLNNLGFDIQYHDWHNMMESANSNHWPNYWHGIEDYQKGRRFTFVATQTQPCTASKPLAMNTLDAIPAVVVNGKPVSLRYVLQHLKTRQESGFLDAIIDHSLIEQNAQANGIQVSEEETRRLKAQLFSENTLPDDLNEAEINQQLSSALRFGKLRGEVASPHITSAFKELENHFETVALSHIVCASHHHAKLLLQRAQSGEAFSQLARRHSLDEETACGGGFIGRRAVADLDVALVQDLKSCVDEAILGPYAIGNHWVIYRLEKRWPAQFDAPTRTQLYETVFHHWLEQTRAQADVQVPLWEYV